MLSCFILTDKLVLYLVIQILKYNKNNVIFDLKMYFNAISEISVISFNHFIFDV